MDQLFSTGQVARLLGVQSHQIEYAMTTGRLAETAMRFLGKRVFTPSDVQRVATHFGVVPGDDQKIAGEGVRS